MPSRLKEARGTRHEVAPTSLRSPARLAAERHERPERARGRAEPRPGGGVGRLRRRWA
jgi:hypothetical protein